MALTATWVAALAVYWIGLNGPLVFDDAQNLAPLNDWLQGRSGWLSVVLDNHSGLFGRPLSMASLVLNVALAGPSIWALKFGNLLLHLVNGVVLFALFRAFASVGALTAREHPASPWWPWLAASIWLLHPLLASTVLYVIQRMAMLSALFMLLAMLAYVHGRIAWAADKRRRGMLLMLVAMPLCTLLAALSKENGVLAPALCAVIELFAFQPTVGKARSRLAKAFVTVALAVPALLVMVLTLARLPLITAGYANRPFTLLQRLLTEARVLWDYVAAILVPSGPRLGIYHDDFLLSHGLLDPPLTIVALLAWPLAAAIAWRLRRSVPALGLGLGIFVVGQALESTVFPLLIYFEHRNYLPAIGIIWAVIGLLAFGIEHMRPRMQQPRVVLALAACALLAICATGTAMRAYAWSDSERMLARALRAHPDSERLKMDLISHFMSRPVPASDKARVLAEDLRHAEDPNWRRLGTVETVLIDCASGTRPDAILVRQMFAGTPKRISLGLMRVFEALSVGIVRKPCPGLSPARMAVGLVSMLDRAGLPASQQQVWRLRFRAANLYLAAGDMANTVAQAKLAYANGAAAPQATLFVARMLLLSGDLRAAAKVADTLERQIRPDDTFAQEQLQRLRRQLTQ